MLEHFCRLYPYAVIKDKFKGTYIEWAILYLKVVCTLLKVHIWSPFKGDAPFSMLIWRFFEEC